ncbi:hypothetical protein GALMADRAFT_149159 [Galerina marginata CBS 339.88]|uniref:Uncharacterized protein n=1 Tax=Galerina marginata (strain CBS 339.88) TaxID=685588 RepID=A0A067SAX1_GALM3|nr:hypothetical protein GALMADRAFT_149159 [Galerina marginata CBS 339.88]
MACLLDIINCIYLIRAYLTFAGDGLGGVANLESGSETDVVGLVLNHHNASPLSVPTTNGAINLAVVRDYLHLDSIGLPSRAPPFLQDVGRLRRDLGGN